MTIKLAWTPGAAHYKVRVFTGVDRDHLASTGTLTMRPDEAERFRYTVRMGVQEPGFTGIFQSGWPSDD
jgi:hypothetical protein